MTTADTAAEEAWPVSQRQARVYDVARPHGMGSLQSAAIAAQCRTRDASGRYRLTKQAGCQTGCQTAPVFHEGIRLANKRRADTRWELKMALFMDTHTIEGGVSAGDVAAAHEADLATQGAHGVNYLRYWVDEEAGKIFCLVEAPDAEAANIVHRDAHGLVAEEIYSVTEHS